VIAGEGAHSIARLPRLKNFRVGMVGGDLKVQGDVQRDR
jgi:hypothetical protein